MERQITEAVKADPAKLKVLLLRTCDLTVEAGCESDCWADTSALILAFGNKAGKKGSAGCDGVRQGRGAWIRGVAGSKIRPNLRHGRLLSGDGRRMSWVRIASV